MKIMVFLMALLAVAPVFSQNKGATPVATPPPLEGAGGRLRAVVIGISDYQDPDIPDLRFADKDAVAFANFLRSPAGGALDGDHLKLLTNREATLGLFAAALDWLIDETREGDQVIIYFSGHGDVERKTITQPGYLLCWDAPSRVYMAGGALVLNTMQEVISTLSIQNKARVIVITDACRAGKLAGSNIGGAQATTANLAKQFANEIKILSCQPDEYSIEGEQWGGGRGAFSFHLVEGLYGMADGNSDQSVNLLEIGRYLEDHVTAEVAPQNQLPMTVGNRAEKLTTVFPDLLAQVRKSKVGQLPSMSPTDNRGMEDEVLAAVDSSIRELYVAFKKALKDKQFLEPSADGGCAEAYYTRLIQEPRLARLHASLRRNYAAALQDDAQLVINQLLRTDPEIVDDAFSPVRKYDHLPACLHRAAELLGEKHYMYRFIKAREYYFKAKACRKENYPEWSPESLLHLALASLDTALTFDEEAAYVYFEKGYLLFWNSGDRDRKKAADYFELAVQLSSEWVLPTYYAGRALLWDLNREKTLAYLKKAIALDSLFLPTYWTIGAFEGIAQGNHWFEAYVKNMEQYVREHPGHVPVTYYTYLGNSLGRLRRFEEAEKALLKGAELSNHQHPLIYMNLGFVYRDMGRYDDAEKAYQKAISLLPLSYEGYNGYAYLKNFCQKNPIEAIPYYQKAIQCGGADPYDDLFLIYLHTNQLDSAEAVVNQFIAAFPDDCRTRQRLGQLYLQKGMKEQAREQFELMALLQPNWIDYYAYFPIIAYTQLGKADSLPALLETERLKANDHPDFYFMAACAFAFNGQNDLALQWLEGAFQRGWKCFLPECSGWNSLECPELYYLRETPEYKALVKKHFPDKFKD